jgi:hypothetical protein
MAATSPTELRCPACNTPGATPGERCSGCRDLIETDACSIHSWRGHESAVFMARREDGTIVATSPTFQWSSEDNDGPRAAFEQLAAELEESGWEPSDHASDDLWHERRFTRLVALTGDVHPSPVPPIVGAPPHEDAHALVVQAAGDIPRRRRGPHAVTLISLAGLFTAAALLYVILTRDTGSRASSPKQPSAAVVAPAVIRSPTPKKHVQQAKVIAKPAAMRQTRVAVVATKDSWLELRRNGAEGAVLYSGVLPAGYDLHVEARRIWARFGAAANLQVSVNGSRVPLQGTVEKTFSR